MQVIDQYIDLIRQFKVNHDDIVAVFGGEETLLYQFYKGVTYNIYINDEIAADALYSKPPTHGAYKTLKTEFKKRLINIILMLDFKQPFLNDAQYAYYTCQKNWAAITILAGRYKQEAAIDLAQTTLVLALRFEMTETIVNTTRVLESLYHVYRPLSKKAEEYREIHDTHLKIWEAENTAIRYYEELSKFYIRSRATQKHLHQQSVECLNKLQPYLKKNSSFRLHQMAYLIKILSCVSIRDYKGALDTTNEAIRFFESKPFELRNVISIFLHQKTQCCMILKKFEEGEESASRSRSMVVEGTFNWYKDSILYVQFCFHTKRYERAWEIMWEVISNPTFHIQNTVLKDEINISLGYLQYLSKVGMIKITRKQNAKLESLNLESFISIAPTFQKDKRGLNIQILVSQILLNLFEKNEFALHNRIDGINKYRTRHINKGDEAYRTELFIKMLNRLVKNDYNRRVIARKAEKYYKELIKTPMHTDKQIQVSEIIPYEDIWELILLALN